MESILLPTKLEITSGEKPNEGILVLEPCYYGYGTTIGNAIRRVLLSSLPGAAVTAVKIKGAQHEFSSIPLVKEDVLDIILNLKLLRLRLFRDEPVRLSLKVKGEKKVTAKDFEKNADVEIVNPELHIATLTDKKAEFELEVVVERGRGYSPTETRPRVNQEIGMVMIDALFSPVRNVGYRVENARVGEITNYDRLIMTIETDGTVSPEDAVRESAKILMNYVSLFSNEEPSARRTKEAAWVGDSTNAVLPEEGTSSVIEEAAADSGVEVYVAEEESENTEEKSKPGKKVKVKKASKK